MAGKTRGEQNRDMAKSEGARELAGFLTPVMSDGIQAEIAKAARPKTPEEQRRDAILATLDELAGGSITDSSIRFEGTRIILPADMEGNLTEVRQFLEDYEEAQDTHFAFTREFTYRPWDVAAAFDRAMRHVFGVGGIGRAQFSFFGVRPPEYQTVTVGPHGETLQVPWGQVEFSLLDATFTITSGKRAEFGYVGKISVDAPKKHQKRIEGFFSVVERELAERSIYRGKAITAHGSEPGFVDLAGVDPARVIYTEAVERQLEVNLWAPLKYTDALRATGVELKRAVLLEGPNGTGKTMAGGLAGRLATENGWTYIAVRAQDDPIEALHTARMYSPAVVMIEDLDTMVSSETSSREQITKVLDELDGVQAKGADVMVVFTTNYADVLDRNVIRPGRLDAVIHIAELDAPGYQRLVRALVPERLLDPAVDLGVVAEAMAGFLPAFAKEATQRAIRYSLARNEGQPGVITTADLVDAARGMADHIRLMAGAEHAQDGRPELDQAFGAAVQHAVREFLAATPGRVVSITGDEDDLHGVLHNAAVSFDGKKE